MIEALLYEKLDNHLVRCDVCGHHCLIKEGRKGICGVRENRQGKLFALNYSLTAAQAIDPIEKKPLYHFLPGTKTYSLATVGCNLHCQWCQNWTLSQYPVLSGTVSGNPVEPGDHVRKALRSGCPSLSYTYSEPTIFLEYALDIMRLAKESGLKNIWVTNGFMSRSTLNLILPYLDAANVDLKAPSDGTYERFCGGNVERVMDNLVVMAKAGIHLEITTLVIPKVNDEDDQLRQIANFIARSLGTKVPWHISRFYPCWQMKDSPITPYDTLAKARDIGHEAGLEHIYLGNV